jgi:hypothetical protein
MVRRMQSSDSVRFRLMRKAFVVPALMLAGVLIAGCRRIGVDGVVVDTNGAPIAAAKLTAMEHSYETDSSGCFSFEERIGELGPDHMGVRIEKEGFKMTVIGMAKRRNKIMVTLARSDSGDRSTFRSVDEVSGCH